MYATAGYQHNQVLNYKTLLQGFDKSGARHALTKPYITALPTCFAGYQTPWTVRMLELDFEGFGGNEKLHYQFPPGDFPECLSTDSREIAAPVQCRAAYGTLFASDVYAIVSGQE